MPKVSIIVPTYNVEQYLEQCMDSIINQTLEDIEIICVDDGSTDNSGKILDEYAAKDSRIKVIHKENGGYGKAMNVGLDSATGEYIGIVEPDDYIKLNMYEDLYKIAHEKNLDLIKADFHRFTSEKEDMELGYNALDQTGEFYWQIINPKINQRPFEFTMNTWSGIYKRDFIKKNNIRHNETPGASFQDNGFWFQTFIFAEKIFFVNKPYYMKRRDNPNSSVKNREKVYAMKHEYDFIYKILEKHRDLKEIFIKEYYKAKYNNYIFTILRIDKKFRKEFNQVFYEDFKQAIENKEIDYNLFNTTDTEKNFWIKMLCENPNKFLKKLTKEKSFLEKLFSIKGNYEKYCKVVTICGLELEFKSKKIELNKSNK